MTRKPDPLRGNDAVIVCLRQAMSVRGTLAQVPGLLKKVLAEQLWRERVIQTGEVVRFDRFEDFVVRPPLIGLGATVDLVRTLVRDDAAALSAFDAAVQRPAHVHRADVDNVNVTPRPDGNARERALRVLREKAPELHERVLAGELSPHAAMVEGGFRQKTITVHPTPDGLLHAATRNLDRDGLEELRDALTEVLS